MHVCDDKIHPHPRPMRLAPLPASDPTFAALPQVFDQGPDPDVRVPVDELLDIIRLLAASQIYAGDPMHAAAVIERLRARVQHANTRLEVGR